jgi:transglutaminase-like putative cysteine protease
MITLTRGLGVPCRYVSGYLYRQSDRHVRSSDGATHAWVEALLPDTGWVGFDPTNNLTADERHIRVAIGRDYADVPPTRGVFKGASAVHGELGVAVTVGTAWAAGAETTPLLPWMSREATPVREVDASQQQ